MNDWLIKWLGGKGGETGTVMQVDWNWRGGVAPGWLVLAGILLAVLAVYVYFRSAQPLSRGRRIALVSLRLVFFGLLLLLFLRPALDITLEGPARGSLLMLVDTSLSMRIKDHRGTEHDLKRAALAQGLIDPKKGFTQTFTKKPAEVEKERLKLVQDVLHNPKLNLLGRLDKNFDIQPYGFAQALHDLPAAPVTPPPTNGAAKDPDAGKFSWVDRLEAKGAGTALGDALRDVVNRKRGQRLAGAVLITDGANNAGSLPLEAATRLQQAGLPLFIYGVGITSPRDIIVESVFAPETCFVKDEATATVRVRGRSLAGQKAVVSLQLDAEKVAQKEITFKDENELVVSIPFTPRRTGDFQLQASVAPRADEIMSDNNSRSQRLRVIDSRIKVLMVEQSPRWEFRYLQAMLLRDRRVQMKCYLVEADPEVARVEATPYLARFPNTREELFQYDLVILGDVSPKTFSEAQLVNLHDFVSTFGGAMLMMAGKNHSPAGYRRTVLEKLLPVELGSSPVTSSTADDRPIKLELTGAGENSHMLRLDEDAARSRLVWQGLPPVYWVGQVQRAKPAAEVLLVEASKVGEKMPVMALQQYGVGHVLYVGTDNTWRWRKNQGEDQHVALWAQMVQRMALQRLLGGSKRTHLSSDKQNYYTGERISVFARLYTPGYEPLVANSVQGWFSVKGAENSRQPFQMRRLPDQPGLYRGELVAPAKGAYRLWVEPDPATQLDFTVVESAFEMGETALNEEGLQELAKRSGGAFFREESLYQLPDRISGKSPKVTTIAQVELWSSPLYFLLLALVVAGEWILRKRSFLK